MLRRTPCFFLPARSQRPHIVPQQGDMLRQVAVVVPMAAVPMGVFHLIHHPLQKAGELHVVHIGVPPIPQNRLPRHRVGEDIVHGVSVPGEVAVGLMILVVVGQLLPPPGIPLLPRGPVDAVCAAHREDALSLQNKHLSPHQVQHIPAHPVDRTAVPGLLRILEDRREVFMVAVHKAVGVRSFLQIIQKSVFRPVVQKQIPEIPAHDERVPRLQAGLLFQQQHPRLFTVGVSRHVNHSFPLLSAALYRI